jgi:hypothetical protein
MWADGRDDVRCGGLTISIQNIFRLYLFRISSSLDIYAEDLLPKYTYQGIIKKYLERKMPKKHWPRISKPLSMGPHESYVAKIRT